MFAISARPNAMSFNSKSNNATSYTTRGSIFKANDSLVFRSPQLQPMNQTSTCHRLQALPEHNPENNSKNSANKTQTTTGAELKDLSRRLKNLNTSHVIAQLNIITSPDSQMQDKTQAMQELKSILGDLVKSGQNAVPGIAIGSPLVTLAALFTSLRYGENIIGPKDIYLQVLIGYFTYGYDRLLDAMDAMEAGDDANLSERKQKLFETIRDNKTAVIATLTASFALSLRELADNPQTMPFIPLLLSTLAYKDLKTHCSVSKPFYIATLWTMCSVVLPSVMHDKNWSILRSPQDLLPAALLMFGSTNLADAMDIEEDKAKGIETLPVKLGKLPSFIMAGAAIGGSLAMIASQVDKLWLHK